MKIFQSIIVLVLCCFVTAGCDQLKAPAGITLNAAHKKFVRLIKEEYKLSVIVRSFENSFWIYIPSEHSIFQIKATKDGPKDSKESSEAFTLNYIDALYQDRNFIVEYDIGKVKKYEKDYGYNSTYTEEYRDLQRNLLTAISRSYGDVGTIPGDLEFINKRKQKKHEALVDAYVEVDKEKVPDFFVIVFADIINGIETRMYVNFQDLKRGMTDHAFQEEYTRRAVSEYPVGNENIIGDKTGEHVDFHEVTWPEFLTKQMVHRIKFKFQTSSNKPKDVKEELLSAVGQTLSAYEFSDYLSVKLSDLAQEREATYTKTDLSGYMEQPTELFVPKRIPKYF